MWRLGTQIERDWQLFFMSINKKPQILHDLEADFQRSALKFLYFGSYALKWIYAEKLVQFQPPDIDFLVQGSGDSLLSLAHSLTQKKWDVWVWGERYSEEWTVEILQGKWYIRIQKDDILCDLSFEYPYLNFPESFRNRQKIADHQLCSLEDIWYLKLLKDVEAANSFADKYGLDIPKRSFLRVKHRATKKSE